MVVLLQMDEAIQVQNLDEAVCISHHINTFGKSMDLTIHPPAINK